MQIKEVASLTGLSIKTIRFYEERGLISPRTEYRNGKNYRDYQQEDIETLNMIAVFRKCLFSLEQIKTMLDHPELTPDVFTEYRIGILTQKELLSLLAEKAETLDPESLSSPEVLARKLTTTANPLPLPRLDTDPHFGKFDPETPEQRQAAYLKWQKRYQHRHLRRWLPVAVTVLVLGILTGVHVRMLMDFNLQQFVETKAKLEQVNFSFTANNSFPFEYSGDLWTFYDDTTYGLYTIAGKLLAQPEQLPSRPSQVKTVEEITLDVLQDRFGSTIRGNKTRLQDNMKKWVEKSPNLEFRQVDIRSNVFQQTMACAIPVEIQETPYYLVIYFRQCPLLYGLRDMAVWYLLAVFVWGLAFAFSASKGYGFRVHFMRAYGPRGTWNNAIIHIDEKTGEGTMLTQQWGGMSNLMRSNQKKE